MIQSMTGFGSKEAELAPLSKISVELRSSNHKFLEIVIRLLEGLLSVEDRIKKEIESKIKRGRVSCAVNIIGRKGADVFVDRALIKKYICTLNGVKKEFGVKDDISINTIIHLPGVLMIKENGFGKKDIWPKLRAVVNAAIQELVKTREKEGHALARVLKKRADDLRQDLRNIKARFSKASGKKLRALNSDEERANFLKDSDISEEMERLEIHARNLRNKLSKSGAIGKELDFIAQEMQREANTLAAKTFDANISSRVVQIKSQVEKIREQVQNIE
jgi:uncharacterized protein (TIGR00255 family)